MKDAMKMVVAGFVGLLVLFGLAFAFGAFDNFYASTIGKQRVDIQREVFEHSKPYVHGKIDDLAKYKREYERATTPEEKKQVRAWVLDEFANFDKNLIENRSLRNFLEEMERGVK